MLHTIGTRIAVTFAVLLLTVGAREAAGAAATVASGSILLAGAAVETRIVSARHCAGFAVVPVEALRTRARVLVHQVLGTEDRRRAESGPVVHDEERPAGRPERSLTLQLPPFLQGLLSHSLVSISQLTPVKPGGQVQV